MSHRRVEEVENVNLSPEEVVQKAIEYDCAGIAFTYNEPTVFYEYMYDTAKLARESGLRTTFHSNGAMNPEPLMELLRARELGRRCTLPLHKVLPCLQVDKAAVYPCRDSEEGEGDRYGRGIEIRLSRQCPRHS